MNSTTARISTAITGTPFEGAVYVVGGALRNERLGLPPGDDIDIVVEGDSSALADCLWRAGLSEHPPKVYPRFGTARLTSGGLAIELVSARAESYSSDSRKPFVRRADLRQDIMRRDFTINTLARNLSTGRLLDLTGCGIADIDAGVIRTPLEPGVTFCDDPLRILRAVRFAVRFGFRIDPCTWAGMVEQSGRLALTGEGAGVVSAERMRDEFTKIMLEAAAGRGVRMLDEAGVLVRMAPEFAPMRGMFQGGWHAWDVWEHTVRVVEALPSDADLSTRLGALLHDVGKPPTRTEDDRGVHFFAHQSVGASMAEAILERLRYPGDLIANVVALVALHMRFGEARPDWSDSALRRLIRDTSPHIDRLFVLAAADMAAMRADAPKMDLPALRGRLNAVEAASHISTLESPLDGLEIMAALSLNPGPAIARAKAFLIDEVIEGRLDGADREGALNALAVWANSGGIDAR